MYRVFLVLLFCFFFKQKTAYEMRISDWSSDVCSSDLDRASGFCYFNDPVLAILALLDGGLGHVFYLDVDAHHGDGVQDAFHDDPRVSTLSIHEDGLWPMPRGEIGSAPGSVHDRTGGAPRNKSVTAGYNASQRASLLERSCPPHHASIRPEAA